MPKDISAILRAMKKAVQGSSVVLSKDPFMVLIATVLSQRTRDANTALATDQLFERYSTAGEIAAAPLADIRKLVRPAGFYKVKAKRVKEISARIVEKNGGVVPSDLESLVSLPGVGRKTANCVLVYGFGVEAIPVDVHVHRISNRVGLVKTASPEQTEAALEKAIPKKHWIELNHLMVKYGQAVCLPRNPKCMQCEIRRQCNYFLAKPHPM
ncbi:MAG: endonuclease III [Candidatus Diapherotrites archaeon]|uniref:Endonuclease III n=1 Tax=Candidatus Iainarchaeum sp. TaxID=3101447 RepID=A0A938YXG6_9ARCH|nr:endonuclease III [Candidatus Diapherotrites archaeon]